MKVDLYMACLKLDISKIVWKWLENCVKSDWMCMRQSVKVFESITIDFLSLSTCFWASSIFQSPSKWLKWLKLCDNYEIMKCSTVGSVFGSGSRYHLIFSLNSWNFFLSVLLFLSLKICQAVQKLWLFT